MLHPTNSPHHAAAVQAGFTKPTQCTWWKSFNMDAPSDNPARFQNALQDALRHTTDQTHLFVLIQIQQCIQVPRACTSKASTSKACTSKACRSKACRSIAPCLSTWQLNHPYNYVYEHATCMIMTHLPCASLSSHGP